MNYSAVARAALGVALLLPAPADAAVNCYPQASGVGGVIADQKDVIAAVNCLGQQLAELRNAATAADQTQSQRMEELARRVVELQGVVDNLSRRVFYLENRLNDALTPPATRPW